MGRKFDDNNKVYLLRKLRPALEGSNESFGLTVPREVAVQFPDVYFCCYRLGASIVFESGAKPCVQGGSK